jgi:uncharacterized DUF497 family protein
MPPDFTDFRWPQGVEDKIAAKHGLERDEVEAAFSHRDRKVHKSGDRYLLLSRTESGEYVVVVLEREGRVAVVISARRMTVQERRRFRRK